MSSADNAPSPGVTPVRLVLGAALVGLAATSAVLAIPDVRFAYRSAELHVAIETAATLVALLAAYLFGGRALRTGSRSDALLAATLTLLSSVNLLLSLLPTLVGSDTTSFSSWAAMSGRLLGAAGLCAAAYAPERPLPRPRHSLGRLLAVAAVAVVTVAGGVLALLPILPETPGPALPPERSGAPELVGSAGLLAAQGIAALLYAAAAAGFLARANRGREGLHAWLAAGLVLGAFSRLHYFLYPSLYSEYVYFGDFLRLGFYLVLLTGLGREIASYQRRLAEAAVFQERRRLARELHDGLAQELAYISSQGRRLEAGADPSAVAPHLLQAARRALEESRGALSALTRPADEPLGESLRREAAQVAERAGVIARVEAPDGLSARPHVREALLRITREAVGNAARHSGAEHVDVSLVHDGELRLTVRDHGAGFDTAAPARAGAYGLTSMTERAESAGGELSVQSEPGKGTTVVVRFR